MYPLSCLWIEYFLSKWRICSIGHDSRLVLFSEAAQDPVIKILLWAQTVVQVLWSATCGQTEARSNLWDTGNVGKKYLVELVVVDCRGVWLYWAVPNVNMWNWSRMLLEKGVCSAYIAYKKKTMKTDRINISLKIFELSGRSKYGLIFQTTWVLFCFVSSWQCAFFLYFRTLGRCYSPEGKSLVWRQAGGGAVVGWTWFWSDTPTWSMASLRKDPFRLLFSPAVMFCC